MRVERTFIPQAAKREWYRLGHIGAVHDRGESVGLRSYSLRD
jgi:hypothetical protein